MLKNQSKIILTLLLSCSIITFSFGQEINKQPHSTTVEGFRQVLTFFKTMLLENYPSLYRYADKIILDKQFDSCYASISPETTELSFKNHKIFIERYQRRASVLRPFTTSQAIHE